MVEITAQSTPDFDDWGWDEYWSCSDWVIWHKKLVDAYGKDEANRIWVASYDKASYGSHEINCSTGSNEFKEYVLKQGLANKSYILSKVFKAEQAIDTVTAPIEAVFDTTASIAKNLKWIIPSVLILATVGLVIYGYRTFAK